MEFFVLSNSPYTIPIESKYQKLFKDAIGWDSVHMATSIIRINTHIQHIFVSFSTENPSMTNLLIDTVSRRVHAAQCATSFHVGLGVGDWKQLPSPIAILPQPTLPGCSPTTRVGGGGMGWEIVENNEDIPLLMIKSNIDMRYINLCSNASNMYHASNVRDDHCF